MAPRKLRNMKGAELKDKSLSLALIQYRKIRRRKGPKLKYRSLSLAFIDKEQKRASAKG